MQNLPVIFFAPSHGGSAPLAHPHAMAAAGGRDLIIAAGRALNGKLGARRFIPAEFLSQPDPEIVAADRPSVAQLNGEWAACRIPL